MIETLKNILYIARRFKLATAFNLLGLIVSFAAFYLMTTQIIYQATYNSGVADCERLYRIDTDFLNNNHIFRDEIFYPIAFALDSMPEVESYSLMNHINDDPVYASAFKQSFLTEKGDTMQFICNSLCNETAVSTLSGNNKALSGQIIWNSDDAAHLDRAAVIIPKSIAKRYFGRINVAGDSMIMINQDGKESWTVRGVYEDFPANSELRNCIYEFISEDAKEYYKYDLNPNFKCIIKFKQVPGDSITLKRRLKQALLDMMDKEGWEKYAEVADMRVPVLKQVINDMRFNLTPLKDSYFETAKSLNIGNHGFKPMFIIMKLTCLLLILIAAIHFLNFALVQSPMRVRGINTRLVLGASRSSLRRGIIAECVITSVTACAIALIICGILFNYSITDKLIDGNIQLRYHALLALAMLVIAGIVGIAAGHYPAKFVTSFTPAMALKSNFGLNPQGHKLRKVIIGIQLFISFLMVIYLGILIQEQRYIFNSSYNYDKDRLLMSEIPLTSDSTMQAIYAELRTIPGIKDVSFSDGSLGLSDTHFSQIAEVQGKSIRYDFTAVDSIYLRTMGITVIEGRHFLPTDTAVAIINKSAREQWDWLSVGDKIPPISGNDSLTIVGVCEDIRYNTTRFHRDHPFLFIIESESTRNYLNLSIHNAANRQALSTASAVLLKHFKEKAKPLTSFDKRLEESYKSEFRFFKWIFILSAVCTLITLIGVFCLTLFESEYRRKEIGIRKVVGATTGEVVGMLCRQYIPLILISFAAAAPIAYISGNQTLTHFAEHTEPQQYWWAFPLALMVVGGIMMGTIVFQSWRTARENPINSIKTE